MRQWLELFRVLGQSLADLARAELAALQAELARNGRTLALALALFGAAAAAGFWLIGLVLYTAIQGLAALGLSMWEASLTVTGFCALVVLVLALLGWVKLRRLESPAATIGRRWQDHREWWDRRLLAESPPPPELPAPGSAPEEPEEELP
jgi:amino acid transporter